MKSVGDKAKGHHQAYELHLIKYKKQRNRRVSYRKKWKTKKEQRWWNKIRESNVRRYP